MINEKIVKETEWKLNACGNMYYNTHNEKIKEYNRGYCQGIAFVLEQIGYRIEWDNGKAIVVKDD